MYLYNVAAPGAVIITTIVAALVAEAPVSIAPIKKGPALTDPLVSTSYYFFYVVPLLMYSYLYLVIFQLLYRNIVLHLQ